MIWFLHKEEIEASDLELKVWNPTVLYMNPVFPFTKVTHGLSLGIQPFLISVSVEIVIFIRDLQGLNGIM